VLPNRAHERHEPPRTTPAALRTPSRGQFRGLLRAFPCRFPLVPACSHGAVRRLACSQTVLSPCTLLPPEPRRQARLGVPSNALGHPKPTPFGTPKPARAYVPAPVAPTGRADPGAASRPWYSAWPCFPPPGTQRWDECREAQKEWSEASQRTQPRQQGEGAGNYTGRASARISAP
jgi:hypothetical protein